MKHKSNVILRGLYMFFYFLVFFVLIGVAGAACLPYIYGPVTGFAVDLPVRQPCGQFSNIFYVLNVFSPLTFAISIIFSIVITHFTIKFYNKTSMYSQ